MKHLVWMAGLCLATLVTPARADQLIQIPTAEVGRWSAEAMFRADGVDERYYSLRAPVGVSSEIFIRYYAGLDKSYDTEFGGQIQILPQGVFGGLGFGSPAVAVGVWDVLNEGPYGRRFFLMLSKSFTVLDNVPSIVRGTEVHFGFGTQRFGTVLFGVKKKLPGRFYLVSEFDSHRWNNGIWWEPVGFVRLRGEFQNGDPFLGGNLTARF